MNRPRKTCCIGTEVGIWHTGAGIVLDVAVGAGGLSVERAMGAKGVSLAELAISPAPPISWDQPRNGTLFRAGRNGLARSPGAFLDVPRGTD